MAAQSSEIDAIAGVTITTTAVSKAAAKCIAQAKGEIPIEVITEPSQNGDGDWLGTEPEIADSDITAEYETEILVIGCGTGGMFTIAAAAEEGAKVIGIDRFSTGVGIRDDLAAIDSRYQKEWGTKIDKFDYITMATQYAGMATDWQSGAWSCGMNPGIPWTKPAMSILPPDTLPDGPAATTDRAANLTATRSYTITLWALGRSLITTPK